MFLFLCSLGMLSGGLGQPNLPPFFTIDLDFIEVEENMVVGSEVFTLQGEDPEGFPVRFSLEETDLFTVDGVSGLVSLARELDREQLGGGQCDREVVFLAVLRDQVDTGPDNVVKVPVSLTITDLNDNSPVWMWLPYQANLYSDLPVGTTIFTALEARDADQEGETLEAVCLPPDQGPNLCDYLEIIPSEENNSNMFRGSVRLSQRLPPHSGHQRYQMKILVSDGTFSSSTNIEFKLLRYPVPPVFPEPEFLSAVVERSQPVGTIITTVRAEDREPALTGEITYSIVENPHDLFEIQNTTGALSLARPLDRRVLRDSSGVLTLSLQAAKWSDQGLEGRSSTNLSIFYMETENTGLDQGNCYCGQKRNFVVQNIVNGDDAEVNEFPWSVFLNLSSSRTGRTAWCGGSLITDRHVLTAAHCLQQDTLEGDVLFLYDDITVTLGDHDLTRQDETDTFVTPSKSREIEKHPLFHIRRGQGVLKYDAAILTLKQPMDWARFPHIRPICLPSAEDLDLELTDKTGIATGWGRDSVIYQPTTCGYTKGVPDNKDPPSQLKKIQLKFEKTEECFDTFDDLFDPGCPAPRITPGVHLCASSPTGDICVGDSGGALTAIDWSKKNHVIFGISSHNLGCNSKTVDDVKLPSVFTNVRNKEVMDWIRAETADGEYCERRTGNPPLHIEIRNLPDTSAEEASVEESASPGQIVSSIILTEADQGESGETRLTITEGNEAGHFTLEPRGDIHVVRVAGQGQLDRETTSQYQLTVVAEDGSSPPRTSTATLVINVKPRPDQPEDQDKTVKQKNTKLRLVFPIPPSRPQCGPLQCAKLWVRGAWNTLCNGEYRVVSDSQSGEPALYKHVQLDRYFHSTANGWTIGNKRKTLNFVTSTGARKTCEPWEILWPLDVTVTCKHWTRRNPIL